MSDCRIHLGSCPVCIDGLCRVRMCGIAQDYWHGIVVCDECEAMWLTPDTHLPPTFSSAEEPTSPVNGELLWSESNRWATMEDIALLGWFDRVTIEMPIETDTAYGQDEPRPGC